MSEVIQKDNSQNVLYELQKKIKNAVDAIGQTAEGYAKEDCPVDTGNLRNSINNVSKGDTVYIGTNVEYAKQVEYNERVKHKNGKAHFLRDAAANHGSEYKKITEAALKS